MTTLDMCINSCLDSGILSGFSHNKDVYYCPAANVEYLEEYLAENCSESYYCDIIDEDEQGVYAVLIYAS